MVKCNSIISLPLPGGGRTLQTVDKSMAATKGIKIPNEIMTELTKIDWIYLTCDSISFNCQNLLTFHIYQNFQNFKVLQLNEEEFIQQSTFIEFAYQWTSFKFC